MAVEILFTSKGKLDCHTCDENLKAERGHEKDGIIPFYYEGKYIYRCPLMLISRLSYDYIQAHGMYEKGFLPNGNGWYNESYKFTQAILFLDGEYLKWRSKSTD